MQHHDAPGAADPDLAAILPAITGPAGEFRHRQHIHLAFLAVRRYGIPEATGKICGWIRGIAAYERAPQKYHHTVSRAWVELVAHHVEADPECDDFDVFARRNPALLDKRLLSRHYRSSMLAAEPARHGWVEPDLLPFPWSHSPAAAGHKVGQGGMDGYRMSTPPARTPGQRKQDALNRLENDVDAWVATADSATGTPYLVPLSFLWDGLTVLVATPAASPTGRNMQATGKVRLGIGPTRDLVLIEGIAHALPAAEIPDEVGDAFAAKTGFEPRQLADPYLYFRIHPQRIQAWREANELKGRELMRDGRWGV